MSLIKVVWLINKHTHKIVIIYIKQNLTPKRDYPSLDFHIDYERGLQPA